MDVLVVLVDLEDDDVGAEPDNMKLWKSIRSCGESCR